MRRDENAGLPAALDVFEATQIDHPDTTGRLVADLVEQGVLDQRPADRAPDSGSRHFDRTLRHGRECRAQIEQDVLMLAQMRPDQSAEALATVGRSIGVTGGGGAQYPLEDGAFDAPDSVAQRREAVDLPAERAQEI